VNGSLSIHGSRTGNNEFLVDGAPNSGTGGGTGNWNYAPPVDAITGASFNAPPTLLGIVTAEPGVYDTSLTIAEDAPFTGTLAAIAGHPSWTQRGRRVVAPHALGAGVTPWSSARARAPG